VSMKATAIAHPMQGLIKYHGLRDEKLRLPYHDSISVATAPLSTITTVEFDTFEVSIASIDGHRVTGRGLERIEAVLGEVMKRAGLELNFRVESRNNFPSGIGLGASSSGFAALATAAAAAAGLRCSEQEISALARLGAGSATRAVTGGFSRWKMGSNADDSYAYRIRDDMKISIIVAVVESYKQTEDAHREVITSPLFNGRLAYLHAALTEMERAIIDGDIERIGMLAERDTLSLHAITMTGSSMMLFWKPETVAVMQAVREMRKEGYHCYFSIDTGATVYVNSPEDEGKEIEHRISELGLKTIRCKVGGPSRVIGEHLF